MEATLAQKAIDLALSGKWSEAVQANIEILKENPKDIDALNRAARAYAETGNVELARKTAAKVLKIDPINTIALKCLSRWKKVNKIKTDTDLSAGVDAFLEEPGKTKLVSLLHPGDEKVFATLDPGVEVKMVPSAHRLSIVTQDGSYIGRLPDDLAMRLNNLIKEGNRYRVLVKSVSDREIDVFIREAERGRKVQGTSSFPPEKIEYVSFTPPELVHAESPIAVGEDLEEAEGTV
ncbi:MAG TPA: tetratricopeptide repeat protein [Patescibacteria group bacterium]|nr:tetratricopeptide repeat protein [Patescibacteria group bacterium]